MSPILDALWKIIEAIPKAELFVSLDMAPDGSFSAYITNEENIRDVERRNK